MFDTFFSEFQPRRFGQETSLFGDVPISVKPFEERLTGAYAGVFNSLVYHLLRFLERFGKRPSRIQTLPHIKHPEMFLLDALH